MYTKRIYKNFALLVLIFAINVYADIYEACNERPSHAFIASNTSCSHYIYCADDESYEGECPDGDYFNELLQTCDPKDLVDCKLNNSNSITTSFPLIIQTPTTSTTMRPLSSTVTASSENNTQNLIKSTTNQFLTQSTPIVSSINTNTTSAVTNTIIATTIPSNINTETAVIVSAQCPSRDNPRQMIFVPHPKSCSDYFICYHGEKLVMHCSSMLHFNSNTGKCDHPENVRCLTDFTNPKEQCQAYTIDLFPHTTNCNYFYSCHNGYLLLQQCPFGYGWDFEKRACTVLQCAICYNRKIK